MLGRIPCGDCCDGPCLVVKDKFNRADEEWPNGPPATDSTGKWTGRTSSSGNHWKIDANRLVITTTGETANAGRPFANQKEAVNITAASAEIRMKIPENGSAYLGVTIRTDLITGDTRVWSAYVKLIPSASDYYYGCGVMQLWDNNESTQIGDDIPLDDLTPGTWHKVKICVDVGLNRAICEVDGKWHHGDLVSRDDAGDPNHNATGFLWVDQQVDDTYYFDDYKLTQLQGHLGYYGSYDYYYSYYDNCPDCRPKSNICETTVIDLENPGCQWEDDGEGGGTFLGGYSGIDGDGLPDNSTAAVLTFEVPEGGGAVSLSIGSNTATVVVNADGTGTLSIPGHSADFEDIEFNTEQKLRVCCMDSTFIATFAATLWTEQASDCGGAVSVAQSGMTLKTLTIQHNLQNELCDDCFADDIVGSPCVGIPQDCDTAVDCDERPVECGAVPACKNNEYPKHAIFRAIPQQGSNCPTNKCIEWFSGVFIGDLDQTFSFHSTCTRICGFPVGILNTQACDAYYDTGFNAVFDITGLDEDCGCTEPFIDPETSEVKVLIGWRFIARIFLDDDCNYRMLGTITEFKQTLAVDSCCTYSFLSGPLGDVMNPPTCPGLSVSLQFTGCFCGTDPPEFCDEDAALLNNCDFRDSVLEVTLT